MSNTNVRARRSISISSSVAAIALLLGAVGSLAALNDAIDPANFAWQQKAIEHSQRMRGFFELDNGTQPTPPVIPQFETDSDPTGRISTLQTPGPTQTSQNAFFANLGTNGRTCFSCHQPQTGWTVSAASVRDRFEDSDGTDPIFRLVDGATCPTDNVTTLEDKRKAYSLLINKGLIRIGLPVPATAQYRILSVNDPYECNTNPVTGLTTTGLANPTAGIVSVYRRPLPSTNLGFLATIMWDGREPSLTSQAIDATLIHAQAVNPPTLTQQQQMVAFESGLFTAQSRDKTSGDLDSAGAAGGPGPLAAFLPGFFIGINDPVPSGTPPAFGNPFGTPFSSIIFELYNPWSSITGDSERQRQRESIARGEKLFNTVSINITGVTGINDTLEVASLSGFCGTCHDTPNLGNHSRKLAINIGITNGGPNNNNPVIDIGDLPVFTIQCVVGPLAGQTFVVTDPGKALISGSCADIGKTKGPILRGLASRAPYFHNGSAATLLDVVNFYQQRFNIDLSDQDKTDLVNFLNAL